MKDQYVVAAFLLFVLAAALFVVATILKPGAIASQPSNGSGSPDGVQDVPAGASALADTAAVANTPVKSVPVAPPSIATV